MIVPHPGIVNSIKFLYAGASAKPLVNNIETGLINVTSRDPQGDCLSSSLFNLAMIPLLIAINNSPKIAPYKFNYQSGIANFEADKAYSFADDLYSAFHLDNDANTIRELLQIYNDYGVISGLNNNVAKCNVAITDDRDNNSHIIETLVDLGIKRQNIFFKGEHFSSLGQTIVLQEFSIGPSPKFLENKIKLSNTLHNLCHRRIINNHVSRSIVSRTYVNTKLSYLLPNSSLHKNHFKDAQKNIDLFVNKKSIMKGNYKYISFNKGGAATKNLFSNTWVLS